VETSVDQLGATRVRVHVTAGFDDLAGEVAQAYQDIGAKLTVPGFRRGRIPQRIIDQRIGRGAVLQEAMTAFLPRAYATALREHGRTPVGRPEIDVTELVDGERVAFTAEVDVRPLFDLPALDTLTVTVVPVTVAPSDVAEQLDLLRGRFASLAPADRGGDDGDVLTLDIVGEVDGEAVGEYTASGWTYQLGTDGLVPGADDVLRGAAEGEVRRCDVTPTEGTYAGRTVELTMTVLAVRQRILPPADDAFAQLASEFDTLAELEADLQRRAEAVAALQTLVRARQQALSAVVSVLDLPVPEDSVAAEVERLLARDTGADGSGEGGAPVSDAGGQPDRAELTATVRTQLAGEFILDRIAEDRDIDVSQEDLSTWVVNNSTRYRVDPERLAEAIVESGEVRAVVAEIRRGKALAWLTGEVRLVTPEGTPLATPQRDDAGSEQGALASVEQPADG